MEARNITAKQLEWLTRMRGNLDVLHEQWYGNRKSAMDQRLFSETDSKIREACRRLGIQVENVDAAAERNEWWDGELYGPLVVLGYALTAIQRQ